MDDSDIAKMLGNLGTMGALAAGLLLILYRVLSKIMERSIAALDRIAVNISENATKSYEHHASVRETMIKMHGDMSAALATMTAAITAQGVALSAMKGAVDLLVDRMTSHLHR